MATGGTGSTYRNNFLNWALQLSGAAPTRPTSLTVALYTDAAGLAAGSTGPTTEATTTNCPGYARQSVAFGTAASSGSISSTVDVKFTASGSWATVNYLAVLDNGGTMIYWAPLSTSRTLASGDVIDFASGQITISES